MPPKSDLNSRFQNPHFLVERALAPNGITGGANASQRTVTVNMAESPLSWLHARGHLSDRQMLAGETLRRDYEAAALGPHVTMSWENIPLSRQKHGVPTGLNRTERMIHAKSRFDGALSAIGPDLSDIAWRVICVGESVPVAEREM